MARTKLYPPSVDPGFPKLPPTPAGWVRGTFGDALEVVERPIKLEANIRYKLLTAKRSRGGITLRGQLLGREVLTKTQFRVKAGDFVISRRQIIHGACGTVPPELDDAVVSNEYSVLRTRPGLLMDFLRHYSHTPYFQRTCFHSSHGVDVEKMIFKLDEWLKREIDLPPHPEQRKIAAILSSVHEVIERTGGVIEQLQIVKKAMIQELLTRGLPGHRSRLKKTDIGEIPEDWRCVPICDLTRHEGCFLADGDWIESKDQSESQDVRLFQVGNVLRGELKLAGTARWVTQSTVRRLSCTLLKEGDILVARMPDPLGRACIVPDLPWPAITAVDCAIVRINGDEVDRGYLVQVLNSDAHLQRVQAYATGSTRQRISRSSLGALSVPIPSSAEQLAIAGVLNAVDARISAERHLYDNVNRMKFALMSLLLTGDLRVTPEEGDA